jgi:hypothetical protein
MLVATWAEINDFSRLPSDFFMKLNIGEILELKKKNEVIFYRFISLLMEAEFFRVETCVWWREDEKIVCGWECFPFSLIKNIVEMDGMDESNKILLSTQEGRELKSERDENMSEESVTMTTMKSWVERQPRIKYKKVKVFLTWVSK